VLQECYKRVTSMLQACYLATDSSANPLCKVGYIRQRGAHDVQHTGAHAESIDHLRYGDVIAVLQGSHKSVTTVFQECYKRSTQGPTRRASIT
jgi:hypothetical protein